MGGGSNVIVTSLPKTSTARSSCSCFHQPSRMAATTNRENSVPSRNCRAFAAHRQTTQPVPKSIRHQAAASTSTPGNKAVRSYRTAVGFDGREMLSSCVCGKGQPRSDVSLSSRSASCAASGSSEKEHHRVISMSMSTRRAERWHCQIAQPTSSTAAAVTPHRSLWRFDMIGGPNLTPRPRVD